MPKFACKYCDNKFFAGLFYSGDYDTQDDPVMIYPKCEKCNTQQYENDIIPEPKLKKIDSYKQDKVKKGNYFGY